MVFRLSSNYSPLLVHMYVNTETKQESKLKVLSIAMILYFIVSRRVRGFLRDVAEITIFCLPGARCPATYNVIIIMGAYHHRCGVHCRNMRSVYYKGTNVRFLSHRQNRFPVAMRGSERHAGSLGRNEENWRLHIIQRCVVYILCREEKATIPRMLNVDSHSTLTSSTEHT